MLHLIGELAGGQPPAPVGADGGGLVHPAGIVQPQVVLNGNDAVLGGAAQHQGDEGLVQVLLGGVVVAQVVPHHLHLGLGDHINPAHQGLVVVCAGVGHAVFGIVVGQVVAGGAGVPGVEGKLQHLHVGEAGVLHQLAYGVGHVAQVFGNDLVPAQALLQGVEQIHAGAFLPPAVHGGLLAIGDGVVFVKAAEVVDAGHIVELVAIPQAGDPPLEAGLLVVFPAVEGIAPELAGGGKAIRRAARHGDGGVALVQLEELGVCPGVGAVHGHVDRDITHDLDAAAVGVALQLAVLLEELELQVHLEFNIEIQHPAVVIQGKVPAQADVLGPVVPALAAEEVLQCHEEGIVLQPPMVFRKELLIIGILADIAALVGLAQQGIAVFVQLGIVHVRSIGAEVGGVAFLLGQHALFDQRFQADEIGISRKGGKALVGRIAIAGGADGQDLPVGLSGIVEPVHKIVCTLGKAAHAVLGRQAGDGQQDTCAALHKERPLSTLWKRYQCRYITVAAKLQGLSANLLKKKTRRGRENKSCVSC